MMLAGLLVCGFHSVSVVPGTLLTRFDGMILCGGKTCLGFIILLQLHILGFVLLIKSQEAAGSDSGNQVGCWGRGCMHLWCREGHGERCWWRCDHMYVYSTVCINWFGLPLASFTWGASRWW